MTITPILPTVRVAGPADSSEVHRLLLLANAENGLMPGNLEKFRWFVQRFLNSDAIPAWDDGPRGCFGVIGPVGGKLEGIVMLALGSFWYSTNRHLEEYVVFVDPEYRRGAVGRCKALTDWVKGQSHKTGLPVVTGIISNHRTVGKVRLYERIFGPPAGAFFLYNAPFHNEQVTGVGHKTGAVVVSSSRTATA